MKLLTLKQLLIGYEETEDSLTKTETVTKVWSEPIKVGESDLTRIYAIWKGKKIEECINNIIKVALPSNKRISKEFLVNGITVDDEKYISLITTPSFMKHSGVEEGEDYYIDYKCEYLFIKEEDVDFIEELENVASLGKLKDKYNNEIAINKDVVSRLGLLTSTGDRVNVKYKMAVLPEMTYSHIANYLQFKENDEGKIDLKNLKELEKHEGMQVDFTAMDGSGFISPKLMNKIAKELGVSYKLDYIGIRTVGNAGKGLLIRFDWKRYLKEEHNLHELIVKDFWGNDIDLFTVDVISNASQIKWCKWFDSYEEMEQLKENYLKYIDILNGFNIIRYNKAYVKPYTLTNYQILSNLALSPMQLQELAQPTIDLYTRIIDREEDAVRIALGDWARENDGELSPTTKVHELIQLCDGIKMVKRNGKEISPILETGISNTVVESLVNKKVHELCGGRIYIDGIYKTVIKDVFSYMDSLIKGEYVYDNNGKLEAIRGYISESGLKEFTNYSVGEIGKRTLARSPLNCATELIKTELVENKMYEKYFKNFTNQILFYAFDNIMSQQSGEDEDLDTSLCINNEIIYNAVIEDIDENEVKWCFRNQFDGKTKKVIFDDKKENMYEEILDNAGNSIGIYSNCGAKLSNIMQSLVFKKNEDETYENAVVKDKDGNYIYNPNFTDKDYTDFIRENFQKVKRLSYYTLYLQMVAIDSVKTGEKVSTTMKKPINWLLRKELKPIYMYHAKYSKGKSREGYDFPTTANIPKNTLLNKFALNINKKIGYNARKELQPNNDAFFKLLVFKNDEEVSKKAISNIEKLYSIYREKQDELPKNLSSDAKKISKVKIDEEIMKGADVVRKHLNYLEILKGLNKARTEKGYRVSTRFITTFFYKELKQHILTFNEGIGTTYTVDEENGDIDYKFTKYRKEWISFGDIDLDTLECQRRLKRLGFANEIRIKDINCKEIGSLITIQDDKVITEKWEEAGTLFDEYIGKFVDGDYKVKYVDIKNNSIGIFI